MSPDLPADLSALLALHRTMCVIREAETRLSQLFADGEIPGFIHLSIGQEAVAAGVVAALRRDDTLASNHRGHGHAIAKGVPLDRFFLEIMGRAEGICKGRGGSMHIADMSVGMLGANGIVGAGLPIAVGSALAHQMQGQRRHRRRLLRRRRDRRRRAARELQSRRGVEAAGAVRVREQRLVGVLADRAAGCRDGVPRWPRRIGIRSLAVDGNDVIAVQRRGAGAGRRSPRRRRTAPHRVQTTRVRGHFEGDPQKYRDAGGDGGVRGA